MSVNTYVIDLFAGAGGTSTAIFEAKTNIKVIACINHDKNAILSHAANHPACLHFTEDIRTINISPIVILVNHLRAKEPTCKIAIWASLECTNFSRAKCGPKCADSRSLAEDMFRYLDAINPDFFWVENVEEFLEWGPLDEYGNPIKKQRGESYKAWAKQIRENYSFKGFYQDSLVSADFGGVTIRKRLFLQFAKTQELIGIPKQTHCKQGVNGTVWKPVRDVLDLTNYGKSILDRKKPLVPKTHKNILRGLQKYGPKEGVNFGFTYYGNSGNVDLTSPCPTLTTKDRVALIGVKTICVNQAYGNPTTRSVNEPFNTITANPKGDVITAKKIGFMFNPQYGGSTRSVDQPAGTLIARQDKAPMQLASIELVEYPIKVEVVENATEGKSVEVFDNLIVYNIFENDDEHLAEIKRYMAKFRIIDMCNRPLTIVEMLQIQGFPKAYQLIGTQTEQKKYIGNSVEINVGIALFKAIDGVIQKIF